MVTTQTKNSGIQFISNIGGDWGGNKFQYEHLSKLYNWGKPYNFGKMVSRVWASNSSLFYPKLLTAQTLLSGRVYNIDTDVYEWNAQQEVDRVFRFMESGETLNGSTSVGEGNDFFFIVLDTNWARTNSVLQLSNNRYMLTVVDEPIPYGNYWKYKVRIQGSNPNSFVPASLISTGMECVEAASSMNNYGNQHKPGVSFGTSIKYRNVVGQVGREFSIDERSMRAELLARKMGKDKGASHNDMRMVDTADFYTGAIFNPIAKDKKTGEYKEIPQTGFISWGEGKVEELVMLDREVMMNYGHKEEIVDEKAGFINRRTAPGWRDLVRDGHEKYHNGNLTTVEMESYFNGIYHTRVAQSERETEVVTGTLGMIVFDAMLSIVARGFVTVDSQWITSMPGAQAWEKQFGAQFKAFRARNGLYITLRHNAMLDDPTYCRRFYPFDSTYTVDSMRMDIYDFGKTNASKEASGGSNVCMVTEAEAEERYWLIGLIDPFNGMIQGQVTSERRDSKYTRKLSGSINVWDTSRIGALVYEPAITI